MTEELRQDTNIENTIDESQVSEDDYPELVEQDSSETQPDMEDSPEPDIEQETPAEEDADFPEPEMEESEELEIDEQVPDEEQSNTSDEEITVESVVEAVLFASDEPLTAARLANIVEVTTKQIREHIESLNNKYQTDNHAFRIEQIAGGYQMLTLSSYNHWLKQLLRVRSETKLSPAAMETLAIVAYKQPVIRADIEAIRGVAVGEVIRSLCYKGLIKIVGRAEVLGRPMLYGTTKKFLEVFGLNTLKDLPKIDELKKPPN
jgi:segregation and condensation protein B